jgi:hypothetical protein
MLNYHGISSMVAVIAVLPAPLDETGRRTEPGPGKRVPEEKRRTGIKVSQ